MSAEAWEFVYGPQCDFLDPSVVAAFTDSLKDRSFILWVGLCCKTWSIARKDDGGPRPLRDEGMNLWGFENLEGEDRERVRKSNVLTRLTLTIMEHVLSFGMPLILENPQSSRLWLIPKLRALVEKFNDEFVHVDYCQYGTKWKKPTALLVFNLAGLNEALKRCSPKNLSLIHI